jgi:(p)ppGpp synthase/HD superfamily hydrolase
MDYLERAIRLSLDAHSGQKYPSPEGEPYVLHPLRVMLAVDGVHAQTAAVLHDVIEDTAITLEQLEREGFPAVVLQTVDLLTHRVDETYDAYIERVATDPIAARVKLADLEDNLRNNRRLACTPAVVARIAQYERAMAFLQDRSAGH